MVVADPAADLLGLVRSYGDPAPCVAAGDRLARAKLIRRRFGLALPPPFLPVPAAAGGAGHGERTPPADRVEEPIRVATAHDGPAIAAIKWRAFGTSYRGILDDGFLDARDIVPPATFWTGRAMVPPSRRHRLFVWGRPGSVLGYLDCGPAQRDDDAEPSTRTGEVYELYVDPCRQGDGGGRRLLEAAEAWLAEVGFDRLELSALERNTAAHAFYRRQGWIDTGERIEVDLGIVAFVEARFARDAGPRTDATGGFWAARR